jgi:hypothetical protein
MPHPGGANAAVAWLRAASDPNSIAGAAFLVSADRALTCAHVVRDHLGLGEPALREVPTAPVILMFEAAGREVSAHVAEAGWWPDSGSGNLKDIAVLHLDDPLPDLDWAGLALSQPRPEEACYIYGALGGYQSIGQTVYAQLTALPNARGWRQLDARPGRESSYFVRRGFSGSPVFDELGNTIWGMVVAVETDPGKLVAFAIPAEALRKALLPFLQSYRTQTADLQSKNDRESVLSSKGTALLHTTANYPSDLLKKIPAALESLAQDDASNAQLILSEFLRIRLEEASEQ